jgi:hypothetical protein
VLPEGVPAEALVTGEAKAAAKGKPAAKAFRKPPKAMQGGRPRVTWAKAATANQARLSLSRIVY